MTTAAYHALTLLIRADLALFEDLSDQLHSSLKDCHDSSCDLVGIAVCGEMAMAFDADQLSIRDMDHRIAALKEFPDARFYACRDGRAERRSQGEFLQAMWFRVIEREKGKKI